MGKLSGTVLILAGVSIAAYTLSAQQDAGRDPNPGATSGPMSAESAVQAVPPAAPVASPPAAAPTAVDSPAPSATPPPPKVETPPAGSPPPATLAPLPVAPQKLRPGTSAPVRVAEAPPRLPVGETAATASPPLDRPALTREIQRQLKRIGCYQGEASGVWSPSVRQAVKAVADRVNASLPTDQPDPVLLAMVQSQEPSVCGTSCPKGQSRAADGRCLPAALVANASKQRTPTASGQTSATSAQTGRVQAGRTKAAPPSGAPAADTAAPPPDGRMSLAGPTAHIPREAKLRPPRTPATANTQRATAAYRTHTPRVRQRSAQRSGAPLWALPFFLP